MPAHTSRACDPPATSGRFRPLALLRQAWRPALASASPPGRKPGQCHRSRGCLVTGGMPKNTLTIAIAGGTGTLGCRVAAELRSRGHDVRVLSRRAPDFRVDLTTGD